MNLSYFRNKLYCNKHLIISIIVHPRKANTWYRKIKEHTFNDYLTFKKKDSFFFKAFILKLWNLIKYWKRKNST